MDRMIELNDDEKKVVEAMKSLRAVSEEKIKDMDQIAKAALIPKGRVGNIMLGLLNKKVVKRITRNKASGYYLIESALV